MTLFWTAALVILTALVAVLALYTLGIARAAVERANEQRASQMLPHTDASDLIHSGPLVEQPAPGLPGLNGNPDIARVVLFVEAGCEPCAVLVHDLRKRIDDQGIELVAVVDDPKFGAELPANWTVVLDATREGTAAWAIRSTPHVFVVDQAGTVRHNAIVNTRREVHDLVKATRSAFNGGPTTRNREGSDERTITTPTRA